MSKKKPLSIHALKAVLTILEWCVCAAMQCRASVVGQLCIWKVSVHSLALFAVHSTCVHITVYASMGLLYRRGIAWANRLPLGVDCVDLYDPKIFVHLLLLPYVGSIKWMTVWRLYVSSLVCTVGGNIMFLCKVHTKLRRSLYELVEFVQS